MGSQIGALFGGLFGDAGQNFVDLQGGEDAVFGRKPDVAPFVPTILGDEQKKALDANISSVDDIDALLNKLIPGYTDMLTQGTTNALSLLRGEIPDDVQSQIQRSDAFQSLSGGFGGTPMAHALTARDLGRTSLDLLTQGNNTAQLWNSIATGDAAPFTITTEQQAATTQANNAGEQATKQFEFNVAAAPDPGAAGIFNVDAALGSQMLSLGLGSIGGIGGGGSQAPSAQPVNWNMYGGNTSGTANSQPGQTWQQNASSGTPWVWSDARLKEQIVFVGQSTGGLNIYEFSYKDFEGTAAIRLRGVIAQEVLCSHPAAVRLDESGMLQVDYSQLDVLMEVV